MSAASSSSKSSSRSREASPKRCNLSRMPRVPVISNPARRARKRAILSSSTTGHESSCPSAMTSVSPLPTVGGSRLTRRTLSAPGSGVPPSPAMLLRFQLSPGARTILRIRPLAPRPGRAAVRVGCTRGDRERSASSCRRQPAHRSVRVVPRTRPVLTASVRGGALLPGPLRRDPDSRSRARYTSG
jgi:hypothetical protein